MRRRVVVNEQEYIVRVDELAYDIHMCLLTGLPVNVLHESELMALIEPANLSIMQMCPNLYALTRYFLDNGIDDAWNIGNMLVGIPR